MRVLQRTDLYRPVIGGLERFVEILSGALVARGHQVDVVTGATAAAPAGRDAGDDVERSGQGGGQVVVHRVGAQTRMGERGRAAARQFTVTGRTTPRRGRLRLGSAAAP